MDVVVEQVVEKPEIKLGDIIEWRGNFYLVCYTGSEITARNFNGGLALFGDFVNMKDFNKGFYRRLDSTLKGAKVYSAEDYQLQLVKK